jgi:hypothetical protein
MKKVASLPHPVHTAELLVPDPSPFEAEITIVKLKKYKLPGSDQIPAELIKAGGKKLLSAIHKLVNSIWNNCLISGRCLLMYQSQKRERERERERERREKKRKKPIKLAVVIIMGYHCCQFHTECYPIIFLQG